MEIISVFKAVLSPEKDHTADSFAYLKPGDKLIGKVLRLEADGRVLIDLGRTKALAQTTLPVEVGQRIPLKVVQTGQPLHLRLDETATVRMQPPLPQAALTTMFSTDEQQQITQIIERFLALSSEGAENTDGLSNIFNRDTVSQQTLAAQGDAASGAGRTLPQSVRQALALLKTVFEPLSMDAPVSRQGEWVQSAVEDHGMLFEIKLAQALEKAGAASMSGPAAGIAENTTGLGSSPATKRGNDIAQGRNGAQASTAEDKVVAARLKGEQIRSLASKTMPPPEFKTLDELPENEASASSNPDKPATDPATEKALRILMQDLKPQLLVLKSHLGTPDSPGTDTKDATAKETAFLRQVVDRMLGHVEQQQQQAVRRAGESEVYQVFTHLLPVKDQNMPVRLKVYYPSKGGPARDDPQHRVAVLLDMDQLGMVRADLAMIERHLQIQFFVRDEQVQRLFAEHVQSVAQALEGVFQQVHIDTKVSKEKIERFEGEDLQGPPLGRINLKA